MKATRRSTVTATALGAAGLVGCSVDDPLPSTTRASPSSSTATDAATADPDRVALDRAVALTSGLLAALAEAPPVIDRAGRLAAMHTAHLAALQQATTTTTTATPSPGATRGRLTAARLRRRELNAQRELAQLAQAAESGPLARVLATMSAGIAAGLSYRGQGSA